MNKKLIFPLIAALFLTTCGAAGSEPVLRDAPHPDDVAWDDREIFRQGLIDAEQPVLDELPGATMYHIGLPVKMYGGREYGAIVYGRGPLFIEALADEMGQRTFDEFMRDYSETLKWGISTGDTFRQLAEQHCQCDLTVLFEEWVYEK